MNTNELKKLLLQVMNIRRLGEAVEPELQALFYGSNKIFQNVAMMLDNGASLIQSLVEEGIYSPDAAAQAVADYALRDEGAVVPLYDAWESGELTLQEVSRALQETGGLERTVDPQVEEIFAEAAKVPERFAGQPGKVTNNRFYGAGGRMLGESGRPGLPSARLDFDGDTGIGAKELGQNPYSTALDQEQF